MRADRLHVRLKRGALAVMLGLGFVLLGRVLFPDSNLGGGLGLLGGLVASIGVVVVLVATIAWGVEAMTRR